MKKILYICKNKSKLTKEQRDIVELMQNFATVTIYELGSDIEKPSLNSYDAVMFCTSPTEEQCFAHFLDNDKSIKIS